MRVRRLWKAQIQARIGGVTEGSILEVHTLVSSAVQRVKAAAAQAARAAAKNFRSKKFTNWMRATNKHVA